MSLVSFKHAIRKALWRFGIDIRLIGPGHLPNLVDFLNSRKVDIVLDVGANKGQFGSALREQGYQGKIVSFEPIKSVYNELKNIAEKDGNWQAHCLALGETAGQTLLNVSRSSEFSSILDQSPQAQGFDSSAAVEHQEEIQVARLDDIFASFGSHTVFLKIDTQGYERHVLEGARESLVHVAGVQMELPLVYLYKNTWSFADALNYMQKAGFVLAQLTPVNWLSEDPVSAIEIDGIFRRRGYADE